jgi:hypothetical protein
MVAKKSQTKQKEDIPNIISEHLKELMRGDPDKIKAAWDSKGMTGAKRMAATLYNDACAGNLAAVRELLDRVEGKPVQSQEHQGDIKITISYEDEEEE